MLPHQPGGRAAGVGAAARVGDVLVVFLIPVLPFRHSRTGGNTHRVGIPLRASPRHGRPGEGCLSHRFAAAKQAGGAAAWAGDAQGRGHAPPVRAGRGRMGGGCPAILSSSDKSGAAQPHGGTLQTTAAGTNRIRQRLADGAVCYTAFCPEAGRRHDRAGWRPGSGTNLRACGAAAPCKRSGRGRDPFPLRCRHGRISPSHSAASPALAPG